MLRWTFLLHPAAVAACLLGLAAVAACSSTAEEGGPGPSSSAGGDGGQGAAGPGGRGGAPPGDCADDDDCPGTLNPCATYACQAGACVPSFPAAGTAVPDADVAGDCQRAVCDGDGTQVTEDDADDIEDDLNPCTADACADGAPTHMPVMDATPCGSGAETVCAAGVCVGCTADGECPLGDGCRDPVCDETMGGPGKTGTCGLVISVGKEVGNAALDDCMHAICNEVGAVVVVANPTETPPQDAETCDDEVCGPDGVVTHQALADGGFCNGGSFCHPLQCLAGVCTTNPDPPDGTAVPGGGGECASLVCDGLGMVETALAPAGTPCSFGVCDGAGNCSVF